MAQSQDESPNQIKDVTDAPMQEDEVEVADKVIGTEECTVNKVVLTIKDSSMFSDIEEKIKELCMELGTPKVKQNKLKKDMFLDKTTLVGVVDEIVGEYVSRKGSGASLRFLIKSLNKINQTQAAEDLTTTFFTTYDNK